MKQTCAEQFERALGGQRVLGQGRKGTRQIRISNALNQI
jgi:hypothetical protein